MGLTTFFRVSFRIFICPMVSLSLKCLKSSGSRVLSRSRFIRSSFKRKDRIFGLIPLRCFCSAENNHSLASLDKNRYEVASSNICNAAYKLIFLFHHYTTVVFTNAVHYSSIMYSSSIKKTSLQPQMLLLILQTFLIVKRKVSAIFYIIISDNENKCIESFIQWDFLHINVVKSDIHLLKSFCKMFKKRTNEDVMCILYFQNNRRTS